MELERIIEILEKHQEWRRDKNVPPKTEMQSPIEIGTAIDYALSKLKKLSLGDVSKCSCMDRILKKLKSAQSKYEGVISSVEIEILDKIEFDFSIFWQPSDGFVMLAFDRYNAPLCRLLQIIKTKGKLTEEDYMDETI